MRVYVHMFIFKFTNLCKTVPSFMLPGQKKRSFKLVLKRYAVLSVKTRFNAKQKTTLV
jgi:hypothetical protein